jgi:hypothetical protein
MYADFDYVFVSNHEWKHLPKKQLAEFLAQRKGYENAFVDIIQEGIKKKTIKSLHPQITVLTILSALRGLEFLHSHKNEYSLESIEENMIQHLLTGIKK